MLQPITDNGNDTKKVNLSPIALFCWDSIFAINSVKIWETVSHVHVVQLMYEKTSFFRGSDELPVWFDRSRERR